MFFQPPSYQDIKPTPLPQQSTMPAFDRSSKPNLRTKPGINRSTKPSDIFRQGKIFNKEFCHFYAFLSESESESRKIYFLEIIINAIIDDKS